jgi:hypothetical protein
MDSGCVSGWRGSKGVEGVVWTEEGGQMTGASLLDPPKITIQVLNCYIQVSTCNVLKVKFDFVLHYAEMVNLILKEL